MAEQRDKFTWYPGDVTINTLSNTVPRLPETDMVNLLGRELYDRILAGFDGPAYDITGDQVTPASLYELYGGTAFNKFMDGK